MFNKVILTAALGQNAEAKTAQNTKEYVVLNIATQKMGRTTRAITKTYRTAPRLCLEQILEVRQDSSEGAARRPGRYSPLSRGERTRSKEDHLQAPVSPRIHVKLKRLSKVESRR